MHHHTIALKSPIPFNGLSPHTLSLPNPRLVHPNSSSIPFNNAHFPIFSCKGIQVSVAKHRPYFANCSGDDQRLRTVGVKEVDVATLGNLCVDIVLNVPKLPPASFVERKAYMERLAKSPPDKVSFVVINDYNVETFDNSLFATPLNFFCEFFEA